MKGETSNLLLLDCLRVITRVVLTNLPDSENLLLRVYDDNNDYYQKLLLEREGEGFASTELPKALIAT